MRSILYVLIFVTLTFGQYVLDRGFYVGVNFSGTGNYLFESLGYELENPDETTYKGTGFQYDFSVVYALNRRNFFEVAYGNIQSEIRHQSLLYDEAVVDNNVTTKRDFSELSALYSYVFPNKNLIFGGGTKIYIPKSSYKDFDLTVNGELHIGLKYSYKKLFTTPYISYAFPLSNLRSTDADAISIGTLQLGIKFWFKVI
jgi:hypothetical protein